MTAVKPFIPVQTVEAGGSGRQVYRPFLSGTGEPLWQAGDTDPVWFEITSLGWSHGNVDNRRDNKEIHGQVFITGARVVAVSSDFVHGSRYRAFDFSLTDQLTALAATKLSQRRARKQATGTFLVGQMRLPWIVVVAYGSRSGPTANRGEVRIASSYETAFGDRETATLLFRLRHKEQATELVTELAKRIHEDRYHFERTTDEQRTKLDALPDPGSVVAEKGKLPTVRFAGSWIVSDISGANGVVSRRSFDS